MKKLILFATLFSTTTFVIKAQTLIQTYSLKTASSPTVVNDVLHYYFNKHYFKSGNINLASYPSFKTDATALISFTAITFCGSKFDIPAGETVTVTGLEAYAKKSVNYVKPVILIRLYLFKINPATGLPEMPPIDSVTTGVGTAAVQTPSLIGGNFTDPSGSVARTMTTSFAVGIRNMSDVSGDYAHFLTTTGATQNNASAPISEKYSDSYGFVRYNGQFYSTKNFSLTSGFGVGTDYEFMVAPRVTYSIQASQILPQGVVTANDLVNTPDTICTRTNLRFTNTSSGFFEHRQYNLNQFYRKWNLYSPFPQNVSGAFASDSSITWDFEFYDEPGKDSRVFLPYLNNDTINAITDKPSSPGCFTVNQFRARLKPMNAFGTGSQIIYNENFIICLKFCNGDAVGINSVQGFEDLKLFPNPAVNGLVKISGLKGKNTFSVHDVLGRLVLEEIIQTTDFEIDLSKQPSGVYLLDVTNSENGTTRVKIINAN